MRPGEIYLARFPFGDVPGMKLRPVLLLTGSIGSVPEVLVAYISSVLPAQPLPSDLILDPVIPPLFIRRAWRDHLGALESAQQAIVAEKLRALLGLTAELETPGRSSAGSRVDPA
jgi:mRNA interferase MazF